MIEKIRQQDLDDMIETLINHSILSKKKNNTQKGGRHYMVRLEVELDEVSEALEAYKNGNTSGG